MNDGLATKSEFSRPAAPYWQVKKVVTQHTRSCGGEVQWIRGDPTYPSTVVMDVFDFANPGDASEYIAEYVPASGREDPAYEFIVTDLSEDFFFSNVADSGRGYMYESYDWLGPDDIRERRGLRGINVAAQHGARVFEFRTIIVAGLVIFNAVDGFHVSYGGPDVPVLQTLLSYTLDKADG